MLYCPTASITAHSMNTHSAKCTAARTHTDTRSGQLAVKAAHHAVGDRLI